MERRSRNTLIIIYIITDIEVADQTFFLTQSQYTDIGPTSPSAGPMTPGAGEDSHWNTSVGTTGGWTRKKIRGISGNQTEMCYLKPQGGSPRPRHTCDRLFCRDVCGGLFR